MTNKNGQSAQKDLLGRKNRKPIVISAENKYHDPLVREMGKNSAPVSYVVLSLFVGEEFAPFEHTYVYEVAVRRAPEICAGVRRWV